ncbi:hypothetical protein ACFPVT_00970 [Corynebacterium choanae]|uniref:Uncharacterized protein n=1 Tax=Corynebacterium choanae TaxID=1862358 RepID=A0A3G6J501_9CORY|nr:hypothetical protein [Corynebacterium choanae]AZA13019.1 hypothetical protein CCHOA_03030 [Corynebacterium choanae]
MSKSVSKNGYVDPAWPTHISDSDGHYVTELVNKTTGANSPYGDDFPFPLPADQVGYVHPYTRVNGRPAVGG